MSKISPLAFIDPEAKIGKNCEIGAFCFIDKNVEIGDNNILMNSVTVLSGARIGNGNTIFPGAVISAVPQDLKFRGEETTAIVGDNNRIRENVTINRGTAAKGRTIVGSDNLLMEGVHVAHDVTLGSGCIIGNSTKIAGEVIIDDYAVISASVLIHQFCHVGGYVMIGGGTRFSLNIVGLPRHGFSNETIENIHEAYRMLYQSGKLRSESLEEIKKTLPMSKEIVYIINFVETAKRGIIK